LHDLRAESGEPIRGLSGVPKNEIRTAKRQAQQGGFEE
jgi:hypothetical protein